MLKSYLNFLTAKIILLQIYFFLLINKACGLCGHMTIKMNRITFDNMTIYEKDKVQCYD